MNRYILRLKSVRHISHENASATRLNAPSLFAKQIYEFRLVLFKHSVITLHDSTSTFINIEKFKKTRSCLKRNVSCIKELTAAV